MLLKLASHSLQNRRTSVLLTVFAIALSVLIVLSVEHIRGEARESFSRTVSGVDLIVGARTSQLNLLLYSVFRIGNATNNISWQTYQDIIADERVAWSIPISLGDSHRGYRVMGTTGDYFEYFRYGSGRSLELARGRAFEDVFDAVLGADVAASLGYETGTDIILSHGLANRSLSVHDDAPFTVVGILARTGTPVDQTIHVGLNGIEAIHLGWQNGVRIPGRGPAMDDPRLARLQPQNITAFMLGLESRMAVFGLQRNINEYRQEALLAIMPGVALADLWQMMGTVENILTAISVLVLLASLLGLSTMLLASMQARQRELALYRSLGAHASSILFLIELEALLIACFGILLGYLLVCSGLILGQEYLSTRYGLSISGFPFNARIGLYMLSIIILAAVLALIPGISAYRNSLASGLKPGV